MKTQKIPRFLPEKNGSDLREFTGTEHYYKDRSMVNLTYTDGVRYAVLSRECLWLVNLIYSLKMYNQRIASEPFVTCEFTTSGTSGVLVFTDGNDEILHIEEIDYTDFTGKGICMWYIDDTLILPSEY